MCNTSDKDMAAVAAAQRTIETRGPGRGSVWRHYKGGLYTVVACALVEATMEAVVVYRSHLHGYVWTRPLTAWRELVMWNGVESPRFVEQVGVSGQVSG